MTDQPLYTEFGFSDDEWGLLVGLPQAVLTAASAAESTTAPFIQETCEQATSLVSARTSS